MNAHLLPRLGRTAVAALTLATFTISPVHAIEAVEPDHSGWSLYMDNDLFVPRPRDQDYTGGLSFTQAGQVAMRGVSLDPALDRVDAWLGLPGENPAEGRQQLHARQFGLAVFTPGEIDVGGITPGDRPYASLLFMAASRLTLDENHPDTVQQSTLTLGVLGLPLIADVQEQFHSVIGSTPPRGWRHQVSAGGEPTFRYSRSLQHLLADGNLGSWRYEIKPAAEAGIGFITDANASISLRLGRIHTPWWSFAPDRAEYFSQPATGMTYREFAGDREHYVWAGAKVKVRPWNALLQGQFRHSDLHYSAADVRPVLLEAWAGVTRQVSRDYWVSWVLRYQTSELKTAPGDHDLLWGSVFINRYF